MIPIFTIHQRLQAFILSTFVLKYGVLGFWGFGVFVGLFGRFVGFGFNALWL
jgi:hypothetical protein